MLSELKEFVLAKLIGSGFVPNQVYPAFEEARQKGLTPGSPETFARYVRKAVDKYAPYYTPGSTAQDLYTRRSLDRKAPDSSGASAVKSSTAPGAQSESLASGRVEFQAKGNTAELTAPPMPIKTLDELLKVCEVDQTVWAVEKHVVNKWDNAGGLPLFQVKAWLYKRTPDSQKFPVISPIRFEHRAYTPRASVKPGDLKKTLVLGDHQVGYHRNVRTGELSPFHDRRAMDISLQVASDMQPASIVVLGDSLDFPEASKYTQLPEFSQTLQPAINEFAWYLTQLRELCPSSEITYMLGNHEHRLMRQIIENFKFAYDLRAYKQDVPFYSLRNLLGLDDIGVSIIESYPGGEYWVTNNLKIIHGEYTNPRKESEMSKVSVIFGHLHKTEQLTKTVKDRHGQSTVSVHTIGCLCRVDGAVPGVSPRPNWNQGFAVVESMGETYDVQHVKIEHGVALYSGKMYVGHDYVEKVKDLLGPTK